MAKRLFLFAGYDKGGIIDDSLILYVRALSKLGDVVLCMDSDCKKSETQKIKPVVLSVMARRHGEYDFGSYKRAYIWAREHLDLSKYDFVYMVNDSVYGPLFPLKKYLEDMESSKTDAFGLVKNTKKSHPHIQSWFIGMRGSVFMSEWFDTFMSGITKLASKGDVTKVYEHGFTKNVVAHGGTWMCLYSAHNRDVYNKIKHYYRVKMPFMKKAAIIRHNGRLGPQISYVLKRTPTQMRVAIVKNAERTYGEKYVKETLSMWRITAFIRGAKYAIKKILAGKKL
ncbi:MAG: hypothetical protein J6W40_04950 [Alphaproteobacteria bacterium]|nr:hypothetical protein [Alphaproteobacteria bacterium]